MPSTSEFRNGLKVELEGEPYTIVEFQHVKPGKGGAFVRTKLKHMKTGRVIDRTFRSGESLGDPDIEQREMQFLFQDADAVTFMDTTTFEQIHIPGEALGDSVNYLIPDAIIRVEFYEVEPVGIELPPTVDLVVRETVPGIKGATASAQVKPATLETGLVIQVPPFVNEGDKVRVSTETGEYQSRA